LSIEPRGRKQASQRVAGVDDIEPPEAHQAANDCPLLPLDECLIAIDSV
jgi:hypothetical protein